MRAKFFGGDNQTTVKTRSHLEVVEKWRLSLTPSSFAGCCQGMWACGCLPAKGPPTPTTASISCRQQSRHLQSSRSATLPTHVLDAAVSDLF